MPHKRNSMIVKENSKLYKVVARIMHIFSKSNKSTEQKNVNYIKILFSDAKLGFQTAR
jgi:hypothetical protein